jgi:hypothetical protein
MAVKVPVVIFWAVTPRGLEGFGGMLVVTTTRPRYVMNYKTTADESAWVA